MSASMNAQLAREYIRALQDGATGETLSRFFAPDVVYEEFPNRLFPEGRRTVLPQMLESAEKGQQLLAEQRYEILNLISADETVVLEVQWIGTLRHAAAGLPAGAQMRDRFATFLEISKGKIVRQRNYDCFDPW